MKRGFELLRRAPLPVLAGILLAACASRPEGTISSGQEDPQLLVARGAEVYGYSCGRCHNARAANERTDRQWDAVVAHMRVRANLTGEEARSVMAFMRALNVGPVERVVYDTVVVMDTLVLIDSVFIISERTPEVVPLPADTMRAVAPPARPPPPPARAQAEQTARELVTRGRNLVAAKGCTGCHVVAGKGGTIGPNLDGVIRRRGAPYVHRKLRNPRFDVANSVMPEYGLSDAEINAIVAYLQSLNE